MRPVLTDFSFPLTRAVPPARVFSFFLADALAPPYRGRILRIFAFLLPNGIVVKVVAHRGRYFLTSSKPN